MTLLGICRQRDALQLAVIIAIFKRGAAFLPIEPDLPIERKRMMLRQCSCTFLLVSADVSDALADIEASTYVMDDWVRLRGLERFECMPAKTGDLAYVIFTSGSTGDPKGAMITQAGMVNHLWAKIEDLVLQPADAIAQTASCSFDISVWQFLAATLVGASVVLIGKEIQLDIPRFLDVLLKAQITILEVVPSHLLLLLDTIEGRRCPTDLSTLHFLLVTGEVLPIELARRWFAVRSGIPLVNAYGPTECSDDVTHHIMHESPAGEAVPIGRAVRGVRLYVVDSELKPVAEGSQGELCVGGIPVGMGYIGSIGRTAEVFVDDPFEPRSGTRLYRTGDLVRRVGETIEYIGRIDQQVKIRDTESNSAK